MKEEAILQSGGMAVDTSVCFVKRPQGEQIFSLEQKSSPFADTSREIAE